MPGIELGQIKVRMFSMPYPQTQRLTPQLPHSHVKTREVPVSATDLIRLVPINDASQRERRQQDIRGKLLAIGAMLLVIGYLVWSIG